MSRSVRGYDVMMSMGDVLRAVIANDGNKKFAKESKVTAGFGTKATARSVWNHSGDPLIHETINASVELPRLHSGAELTRHQADTFVGFGLHELAKACYSDRQYFENSSTDSNKMYAAMFKALESTRAEKQMLKSGLAPNARRTYECMSDVLYAQQMAQGYNANDLNHLPATLHYLSQARNGYSLPFVNELRESMNKKNLALIDKTLDLMDQARDGRAGTLDTEHAVKWLLEQLDLPPSNDDGSDGEGDGQGEESNEKKQGKGKGKGKGKSGNKDQKKNQGSKDSGDQDGEGKGKGQGDQQGEGDGQGQGDEGSGDGDQGQGQGDGDQGDGDGDGGSDGDGNEGNGGGDGESERGERSNVPAKGKGGKGYSPPCWTREELKDSLKDVESLNLGKSLGETAKEINSVAEKILGEDKLNDIPMTDECRVEEMYQAHQTIYDELKRSIPSNLGSMRHALWRLLQSKDEHIVQRFQEYGRWDQRALPRMLAGSGSLYKQEGDVIGMKTCVSIILDLSGSMAGTSIYNAAAACIAMSETMEQLASHGVAYEILGFCDTDYTVQMHQQETRGRAMSAPSTKTKKKKKKWWSFSDDSYDDEGASFGSDLGASRWSSWRGFGSGFGSYVPTYTGNRQVGIIQFKGFADKLASRKLHIAQMTGRPNGGTPDSQGLLIAIKDVINRPEPNKIVMVLTDGMGDYRGIQAGCAFAKQIGVDVIGVGIGPGTETVNRVYPNSIHAANIGALGQATFSALVQQIEKNRRMYFGRGLHRRKAAA